MSVSPAKPRILVIFPGALGDLICLGPALRALTRRHLEAEVELMAREELARFAVGRLGVARGHSIDRREVAMLFADGDRAAQAAGFFGGFAHVYSFFAADNQQFRRGLKDAVASGTVSFCRFRPEYPDHVAAAYLGEIGEQIANGAPLEGRIDLPAADVDGAQQALAEVGLMGARVVLVFPGSGSARKSWPLEGFTALASTLPAPIRPLAVLGPAELGMEQAFTARGISTLAKRSLATIAGLASLAEGFVGNDSGISHLAAASGARGVVIFGPTAPERWRPLGQVTIVRARALASLEVDVVATALAECIGLNSNFLPDRPSLDEGVES